MGASDCGSLHHFDMQNESKILAEEAEGDCGRKNIEARR